MAHHVAVQVAALAGVDLDGRRAGGAHPLGVHVGLLVALDHGQGEAVAQVRKGAHQKGGLTGAGAGHEIDGEHPALGEETAVAVGVTVVLAQDVLFDAHHAGLAQTRDVDAAKPAAEVQVVVATMVVVAAFVVVIMVVAMVIAVLAGRHVGSAAAADSTHHATSSSLMRNSSPPVTCSW